MEYVDGPVRVRVPASSANLGPGFDSLGLALGLHDVVAGEVSGAELVITAEGEGSDELPRDETHLVHRAMVRGFDALGAAPPGLRLHCVNSIPHGRGLGSSSAAIVGGLALARALVVDGDRRLDDQALFGLAAKMEGHPDNVAPAVFGGFTVAYACDDDFAAVRLEVTSPVAFVALVPSEPLHTEVARGLLPTTVSHADASFNAGRAALLVAALTGRPDLLLSATEDRLHQGYRAAAMPDSAELIAALRADGLAAVLSGAGPTVLALADRGQVAHVVGLAPAGWSATELELDRSGVRVLP
ncbi:MAG TPA: homoserine kinase [Marmoricola sp.]|nr:homoserine kinase [Marmoricola sp.]